MPITVSGFAVRICSIFCWPLETPPAATDAALLGSKREMQTDKECTSVDFESGFSNTLLNSFPINLPSK